MNTIRFLLLLSSLPLAVTADPSKPDFDRVELTASAETRVENDRLVAQLFAQADAPEAASAAEQVNAAMTWAVRTAEGVPGIQIQTRDFHTAPIYHKGKIRNWRVSQVLQITGGDAASLGALLARLQQRLAVRSMAYQVSEDVRRATEVALTNEAISRFKMRAQQVAQAFGRAGYRLVRVRIDDRQQRPAPIMRSAMAEMQSDRAGAAAQIEAGTQSLSVWVSGEIQLDPTGE